jgi:hypothetical protein
MSVVLIIEIHFGKIVFLHNSFWESNLGLGQGVLRFLWGFFCFNSHFGLDILDPFYISHSYIYYKQYLQIP